MLLIHSILHFFIHAQFFSQQIHIKISIKWDPISSDTCAVAQSQLKTSDFLSGDRGAVPVVSPGPCRAPAGQRQMCSSKVLPASLSAEALISVSLP